MTDTPDRVNGDDWSRRQWMKGIGLASSGALTALAGCSGDGGDQEIEVTDETDGSGGDGGDADGTATDSGSAEQGSAGERIPTLDVAFWSDSGGSTRVMEDAMTPIVDNLESLGLAAEPMPQGISNNVNDGVQDARTYHMTLGAQGMAPSRMDPLQLSWRYQITWAGTNPGYNVANWVNCEYSNLLFEAQTIADPEEYNKTFIEAWKLMSEEVPFMPLIENYSTNAANLDQVALGGVGVMGIGGENYQSYIKSEPKTDAGLITNMGPGVVESRIANITEDGLGGLLVWNHLVYSPLVEYDENLDGPNPSIASDWELSDDGLTYTFTIDDSATFHNGDPVTAEDVKYTIDFIVDNSGDIVEASDYPISGTEVVDERTVSITTDGPYQALIENVCAKWGIVPKSVREEAGANENPVSFELPEIVGSGPFQVESFGDQALQLSSFDGHPTLTPKTDSLIFAVHSGVGSAVRAFQNGEINMISGLSPTHAQNIENSNLNAEVQTAGGYGCYHLYPQDSFAPGKFKWFREAVATALNRNRITEVVSNGGAEVVPHTMPFSLTHPAVPAENPSELEELGLRVQNPDGDAEAARKFLEDAGCTWDDSDRVRYPSDVDLAPLWPKDDEPVNYPDKFPCADLGSSSS